MRETLRNGTCLPLHTFEFNVLRFTPAPFRFWSVVFFLVGWFYSMSTFLGLFYAEADPQLKIQQNKSK